MSTKAGKQDDVIEIKEAAAILGVSVPTVRRMVSDGKLRPLPKPAVLKRVHRLRFRRADVEALRG